MSGRDDVSNEYLLHSLAQGEVSPEVAAATSLTVEVRQLRAERTTPAPVSGAGLDLDASHVRTDPACTFHDGTTPPASRGKRCPACMRLDLDAMARRYSTATDDEVIYEMYPALEAEVRRLTAVDDDLSRQIHETGGLLERAQAAVDAEAEVVTLRARLAAVEAELEELRHWTRHDRPRLVAVEALTGSGATPDGEPLPEWVSVHDLRAALAVTTGEGEHVAREVFTADGIPFVSCLCTNAKSPTRWLTDWLIRYDPDDGEPYGEVCDCEIGDDHDATGEGE